MERVVFKREADISPALQERWGWLIGLGIIEIVAGIAAIALPVAATFFATVVISWVLMLAGVTRLVQAMTVHRWRGFVVHVLSGGLYLATGVLVVAHPVPGALSLVLIVASLLVADGLVRSVFALRLRPADGWGWLLASAIASAVLGVMLLANWPTGGLWTLGLMLGINLMFGGASSIALGLNCRDSRRGDSHWIAAH